MCWPEAVTQTAKLPNGSEKWSRNLKKKPRKCDWKEREVQGREGGFVSTLLNLHSSDILKNLVMN